MMENPIDYLEIAYESNIEELYEFARYQHAMLVEESMYIRQCLEAGYITVFEASDKTQSIWKSISNKVKEFFSKLRESYYKRAVKLSEKYVTWLNDSTISAEIRDRAKTASKTMAPYWKGDYIKGRDIIKSAMTQAFNKFNNGKYDDYTWGADLGVKSAEDIADNDLGAKLKALFKFGSLEEVHVKRVTITGTELSKIVDDAISYVTLYKTNCTKSVNDLTKTYENSRNKAKPPSTDATPKAGAKTEAKPDAASESYYRFFDIEGCMLCETSLGDFDFMVNNPEHKPMFTTHEVATFVNNAQDFLIGLLNGNVTLQDATKYNELIASIISCRELPNNPIFINKLMDDLDTIEYLVNERIAFRDDIPQNVISLFRISEDTLSKWRYKNGLYTNATNTLESILYEADAAPTNTNNDGEKDKPEKQDSVDEDGQSVKDTTVTSGENDPTDPNKSDKTTTSDSAASTYLKNIDSLFKLAISAFATACEERFVTFIALLKAIGDKSGKPPKFDKDGKYIPRAKQTEAEKRETDQTNNNANTNTDTTSDTNVS